jgi:hypothetical protein
MTGLGVCSSGTFADELFKANADFTSVRITRHYRCADGVSTFDAREVLVVQPAGTTATVSGDWRILGGTGALHTMRGHGVVAGRNVGCAPGCTSGTSAVDGVARLD